MTLTEDESYSFKKVSVRTYDGVKYLSVSEKSPIEEISDIGEGVTLESNEEIDSVSAIVGELSTVISAEEYLSCVNCGGKVQAEAADGIVECSKCAAIMKWSKCPSCSVARVVVEETGTGKKHRLTVSRYSAGDHQGQHWKESWA